MNNPFVMNMNVMVTCKSYSEMLYGMRDAKSLTGAFFFYDIVTLWIFRKAIKRFRENGEYRVNLDSAEKGYTNKAGYIYVFKV